MGDARRVFDEMPERNEVSFTTMMAGCLANGVDLYFEMLKLGLRPN